MQAAVAVEELQRLIQAAHYNHSSACGTADGAKTMALTPVEFKFTVPEGVTPGQAFRIMAEGAVHEIRCPPTAVPGSVIKVQLPTSATAPPATRDAAAAPAPVNDDASAHLVALQAAIDRSKATAVDETAKRRSRREDDRTVATAAVAASVVAAEIDSAEAAVAAADAELNALAEALHASERTVKEDEVRRTKSMSLKERQELMLSLRRSSTTGAAAASTTATATITAAAAAGAAASAGVDGADDEDFRNAVRESHASAIADERRRSYRLEAELQKLERRIFTMDISASSSSQEVVNALLQQLEGTQAQLLSFQQQQKQQQQRVRSPPCTNHKVKCRSVDDTANSDSSGIWQMSTMWKGDSSPFFFPFFSFGLSS